MSSEWLVELAWKSLLLSAVAMVLLALAGRRSAGEKSLIGDAGLLSLLLLPVTISWLPRVELAAPQAVGEAVARFGPEGGFATAAPSAAVAAQSALAFDWNAVALGLYLLPAVALHAGLALSLVRLRQLYGRALVLEDAHWLTALAAAQNRLGVKHGTALLISDEVNSPISWGVVRPVIMIDPAARASGSQAEAIIAHELAHVNRLDWLKLIIARVVVALFWFNPLVWVLARRSHQLREEAADDAVLNTRLATSDYADLLITAVRHSNARPLVANGVAPSKSSISQRVAHVLDTSRPRRAAPFQWAAATMVMALAANAAVAASEPVFQRSWGIDPNAGERAAAELALLPGLHPHTLAAAIRARDWSARRVEGDTTFSEPRAVRPLLLALRDDHPAVRRIAVWGLSEMRPSPDPLATPAVSRLLGDASPQVRAQAARAIGDFESVKNSRSIEKLLVGDPSPLVRREAAHALGDIRDPGSRASLEIALRDPDRSVRD
ncbi:MAG: HEAT repeat domain-containing protein, partial [Pseudomonadota bacterium]|nr:HEAT repeat domain-containing protein [Pseudomonadota bacterium]